MWLLLAFLALLAWMVTPAAAAESRSAAGSEAQLLVQIVVLVIAGRLLGEAMLRFGQPAVMGYLLAGVVLGPSCLGLVWPAGRELLFPHNPTQKAMLDGISQFGILMLLLLAGMETDLALVKRVRRAAFTTSAMGIIVPFTCGFALGMGLPESLLPDPMRRLLTALFLGTALSISSVKIVATVIREMGFLRRDIGQIILASAIVDDTIGWIIIAITLSLASQGVLDWWQIGHSVLGTLLFLVASFTFGRKLVFKLIQWSNDHALGEAPVIATIIVVVGGLALTTDALGVHTVLGAFVAGILVGESPILTTQLDEQLRGITAGLFMPVFFGLAGMGADLTVLADPRLALLTVALIAIASLGKTAGAFAGGALGGLSMRQSTALATGMNARGSTEVIVASIGLSMGVLNQNLYTMIVAMAFITTMVMPPTLRWALARLPIEEEERKRLSREEIEAKSFLSTIERILVVADAGANGRLAARIGGILAGADGKPVTVLKPSNGEEVQEPGPLPIANAEQPLPEIIRRAARSVGEEATAGELDVIERHHTTSLAEAVATEAHKGYDLLIIGVDPLLAPDGGIDDHVSQLARKFPSSIMLVSARGRHELDTPSGEFNILAPVTGSEVARKGVEVALALGRGGHRPVTAITVIPPDSRTPRRRFSTRIRDATATAREVRELADALEQPVRMAHRANVSPQDAILREARAGNHDLIVMGTSRRPGERLSFGDLAASLLDTADRSLVFVAPTASPRPSP
jgi:Kef-type K+ transport system membrane component KefB/nucleotide-binding universal stress UspA family protein